MQPNRVEAINRVSFEPQFDDGPGRYRIGLILLSNDYATERDFVNMRPPGDIAFFAARIPVDSQITPESLARTLSELSRAASLILPGGRLDAVAYSCTSAAVILGHQQIQEAVHAGRPGVPCITPINAAVAGLRALGAGRIAVLTPYIDSINRRFQDKFADEGLDVRSFRSFGLAGDLEMANLSPESIARGAIEADCEDAEAVFISCTAIRAVEVIDRIEQAIGKPVVTSIQAMFWQCLRTVGYREPLRGYGRLLETS